MDISDKLKKARNEKGLTQKELAIKIDVVQSVIGEIESSRRIPSKATARKLSDFFNTSIDYWMNEAETDKYFSNRQKYAMFDEVLTTLIESGKFKDGDYSDECWDLIKDAVKIESKILVMKKDDK